MDVLIYRASAIEVLNKYMGRHYASRKDGGRRHGRKVFHRW